VGVIPAIVEGQSVTCPPKHRETPAVLVAGLSPALSTRVVSRVNPITTARGLKRPDAFMSSELTLVDLAGRANAGLEVSRSMLTKLVVTPTALVANPDNPCTSRVLAAPVLDSRDVRPFGDPS